MTSSEYTQKLVDMIGSRPARMNLDKLLYEVYVRAKIAEARRNRENGNWATTEQVMEGMWAKISSKSAQRFRKRV